MDFTFGHAPADLSQTPIKWPIHPEAFHDTLLEVSTRYGLPIYVLENGFGGHEEPDAAGEIADAARIDYLKRYIEAMHRAIAEGADVRGYFVWSLLDNFEWGSGYGVRFGLVYVDYPTQKRIPKASFRWYANLIKSAQSGKALPRARAPGELLRLPANRPSPWPYPVRCRRARRERAKGWQPG